MDATLNSVYQRVEKLFPSGRFYAVIHDPKKGELSFPFVRQDGQPLANDQDPWVVRPCERENQLLLDQVILGAKSIRYESNVPAHLAEEKLGYWPDQDPPRAWMGVPMNVGQQVIGALVVESWQEYTSFTIHDEQTLTSIARLTAIAIENLRIHNLLEHKIENLRTLNYVGQQLGGGLAKEEKEILELIYESATGFQLDTQNMYIAFYNPDPNHTDAGDDIHGTLRHALSFEDGVRKPLSEHPLENGLVEHVIRTKASFNPPDVKAACEELALEQREIPQSWLGVPMLSEGNAFGVIVLYNNELEQAYSHDARDILEILAGQAAVALQNQRLYETQLRAQEQKTAAENMAVMSLVAAEFAHKMNNLAGTIPVRINRSMEQLDPTSPRDEKIRKNLTQILKEAEGILRAAQEIRESSEPGFKEDVDVNRLLEIAISRAINTQENIEDRVQVTKTFTEDLPVIKVERSSFIDALTSMIKNSFEAIQGSGSMTVETSLGKLNNEDAITIKISDTGQGIPQSELPKIFDLFYTTKGEKGLGFGLWRDKIFFKKLGGEIDVDSELNAGTTFTIRIPVRENMKV